ncbi:hypothetical protein [Acetobacter fallax]|uniref:Uncharacterized protein n=1 Tax=Acetobacter fallax TaxID=1737473 RepID=A0ABX0KC67_9PROT|nr:hypothetical protein [Acetobacter fallax]NHO32458.1 hypothetical protein [Acetobacter fallax]NHO36018.1 hypothetical protein [Acetobacter fallax]
MSAASRLWRRAPLWRLALFGMVFFSAITVFYPAPWLLRVFPPFSRLTHKVDHMLGRDAPPAAGSDETAASETGQAPPPAPAGGNASQGTGMAAAPPIDSELTDILPFAGRQLPLPAGTWHPVVTTQDGPHGELTSNVLVRTDKGVVTGVIIARATTASVPPDGVGEIEAPCHDDRDYMRRVLGSTAHSSQCVATYSTLTISDNVSGSATINWAFKRLHVLGFPMPPVLVSALWSHIVQAQDGGVNFQTVEIALSPADPGSAKLSTSLDDWSKQGVGRSAFTARFVGAVNEWIIAWAPTLLQGYDGALKPASSPRPGSEDPAWHG